MLFALLGLIGSFGLAWLFWPPRRRINLRNETVVVTGGAQGIGYQIAIRLARLGALVHVWDVDAEAVAELEKEARAHSLPIAASIVDISKPEDVRRAAQSAGLITILVNNAGVASVGELLQLTETQIKRAFEVNVLAQMYALRATLPDMIQAGHGHIVSIGSVMGYMGAARLTDYCASKAAVNLLHEALVMELSLHPGITSTLVCPATTDSRMFRGAIEMPFFTTLKTSEVADAIVNELTLLSRRHRVLMLPAIFYLMPIYQALPMWAKVMLTNATGANNGTANVRGTNPC